MCHCLHEASYLKEARKGASYTIPAHPHCLHEAQHSTGTFQIGSSCLHGTQRSRALFKCLDIATSYMGLALVTARISLSLNELYQTWHIARGLGHYSLPLRCPTFKDHANNLRDILGALIK